MNEETDPEDRFIKEIVSGLRTAFKSEDFNAAEDALAAHEAELKLEIARLRTEKQSVLERRELERMEMADLRDRLDRRVAGFADTEAREAEERLVERMKALEEEKESLVSEVSELRKRARNAEEAAEKCKKELKERVAALEADLAELSTPDNKRLRNLGFAKFSLQEPIEILDSDDDNSDTIVELAEKESSPKILEPKISYSPNVSETKNNTEIGAKDSLNKNTRQEPKSPVIEPVTSTPDKENPVTEASSSNNGSDQLNNLPDQPKSPVIEPATSTSDRVGQDTGLKRSILPSNYGNFWDQFGEIECLPLGSK